MGENERDPQADLALCEAATPGPWTGECGSLVNWRDGTFTMEFIPNRGGKPQYDADLNFMAMAREALPWYIRAYLAQREEIERLKTAALAEANTSVRDEVIGNLHHLGVTPHCDWQGHSVGQVVGCEVSALQMELEGVYAGIDQHGMEALNRQLQCQREELEQLRAENDSLHVVLQEANDTIERMSREQSEESALARLRAWREQSPEDRRWTREEDWGAPTLELYQSPGEDEYRYVCVASGDTFAMLVDAALAEWERKYGEGKPC